MEKQYKSNGRPSRPIIITAIAEDADTRLVVGQVFSGGAKEFSKAVGYTPAYLRKALELAPALSDTFIGAPMGPATLRGISFWYLDSYSLVEQVRKNIEKA